MKYIADYPLTELKLIYHLLHLQFPHHAELIGSQFIHELQVHLQAQARGEGVDVDNHGQWSQWLKNK